MTVFLLITNLTECRWVRNWMENCHHDHIPLKLKGILIINILYIYVYNIKFYSIFTYSIILCKNDYTEKSIFSFPFTLNGIWSWWQFSIQFWTKLNSIWFKIWRKTIQFTVFVSILNLIEFHLVQNRMENCHHDHSM